MSYLGKDNKSVCSIFYSYWFCCRYQRRCSRSSPIWDFRFVFVSEICESGMCKSAGLALAPATSRKLRFTRLTCTEKQNKVSHHAGSSLNRLTRSIFRGCLRYCVCRHSPARRSRRRPNTLRRSTVRPSSICYIQNVHMRDDSSR